MPPFLFTQAPVRLYRQTGPQTSMSLWVYLRLVSHNPIILLKSLKVYHNFVLPLLEKPCKTTVFSALCRLSQYFPGK